MLFPNVSKVLIIAMSPRQYQNNPLFGLQHDQLDPGRRQGTLEGEHPAPPGRLLHHGKILALS